MFILFYAMTCFQYIWSTMLHERVVATDFKTLVVRGFDQIIEFHEI